MEDKKVKVTSGVFNAIKLMLKGGAAVKECSEFMNISTRTVSMIKVAETYEEYKNMIFVKNNKRRWPTKKTEPEEKKQEFSPVQDQPVQVVEHRQSVTIQATHYMMEEMKKTNELLTTISAKLAFIVDELTGVKSNG